MNILMTQLRIGDRFIFDGETYPVAEPPQSTWGMVEAWTEELNGPVEGVETSTIERQGSRPPAPMRARRGAQHQALNVIHLPPERNLSNEPGRRQI